MSMEAVAGSKTGEEYSEQEGERDLKRAYTNMYMKRSGGVKNWLAGFASNDGKEGTVSKEQGTSGIAVDENNNEVEMSSLNEGDDEDIEETKVKSRRELKRIICEIDEELSQPQWCQEAEVPARDERFHQLLRNRHNAIFLLERKRKERKEAYVGEDTSGSEEEYANDNNEVETDKETRMVYEVERIIDERNGVKGLEYLVKWKGWPDNSNTWEPMKNLNCPSKVIEYTKPIENQKTTEKNRFSRPNGSKKGVKSVLTTVSTSASVRE